MVNMLGAAAECDFGRVSRWLHAHVSRQHRRVSFNIDITL